MVLGSVEVVVVNITPEFKILNPLANETKVLNNQRNLKFGMWLKHRIVPQTQYSFAERRTTGTISNSHKVYGGVGFGHQLNQSFGKINKVQICNVIRIFIFHS